MVRYEDPKELKWFPVEDMGIKVAAIAYSRPFPKRDRINWIEGLELAAKLDVDPIPHKLMYKFVRNHSEKANEFCRAHGNNNHAWFTGTFAFYSRKRKKKHGKPVLEISNDISSFTIPEHLFEKVCFVEYPNYQLVREDGKATIRIPSLENVIICDYDQDKIQFTDFYADSVTKLPIMKAGKDISFSIDRKVVGLLCTKHGPYKENEPYWTGIHQGAEGFIVYREL